MIALLEVLSKHLPAVERDLIVAGLHFYDLGTPKLSWYELESFVMMAPPGSSTHTSRTNGWNADAQMLAVAQANQLNTGKPPAGGMQGIPNRQEPLRDGRGRNLRNEVHPEVANNPNRRTQSLMSKATAMPLDQFKSRMEERHKQWAEDAAAQRKAEEGSK